MCLNVSASTILVSPTGCRIINHAPLLLGSCQPTYTQNQAKTCGLWSSDLCIRTTRTQVLRGRTGGIGGRSKFSVTFPSHLKRQEEEGFLTISGCLFGIVQMQQKGCFRGRSWAHTKLTKVLKMNHIVTHFNYWHVVRSLIQKFTHQSAVLMYTSFHILF